MRLAFWRAGKDKAVRERRRRERLDKAAAGQPATTCNGSIGDLDLHAFGQALMRKGALDHRSDLAGAALSMPPSIWSPRATSPKRAS